MFRSVVVNRSLRSIAIRQFSCEAPVASYLSDQEVSHRIINVVKAYNFTPKHFSPNAYFVTDLGFDSLSVKDLIGRLGEEFCIDVPTEEANKFIGIQATTKYFTSNPKAR